MTSTTSLATIRELRKIFTTFRLPEQLVSDNGPQFVLAEFSQFLKSNGIKHIKSAPYAPSTNGIAERFVQSFKRAMLTNDTLPLDQTLANFLLQYCITVYTTTNATPCMLLMNRQLHTRLDLLQPDIDVQVTRKQADQKISHDQRCRNRELMIGQRVMEHNLRPGPTWIPGTIIERSGPLSYVAQVKGEQVWKRHIDQLREVGNTPVEDTIEQKNSNDLAPDVKSESFPITSDAVEDSDTIPPSEVSTVPSTSQNLTPSVTPNVDNQQTAVTHRYPRRSHQPPQRYHT